MKYYKEIEEKLHKCKKCDKYIYCSTEWYCRDCRLSVKVTETQSWKDWYDIALEEREKKRWKKESDNKLSYELDRYFIEAMAKRMDQHKGKYAPYNRQKPMDVQKLKEALTRHHVEIQKGNYDDEDKYDHLSAIACNAMFIYYQLTKHD